MLINFNEQGMKLLKIIAVVCCLSIIACKPSAETKAPLTVAQVANENLQTVELSIKGMTCAVGCAKTIESKVAKIDGVVDSKVDFEAEKGTFKIDKTVTSEKEIASTINNLLDGKTYTTCAINNSSCDTKKKPCDTACMEKCKKEGKSCAK